jgi:ubiquinone/menaquinone biosynthesis C-methylase UbiE
MSTPLPLHNAPADTLTQSVRAHYGAAATVAAAGQRASCCGPVSPTDSAGGCCGGAAEPTWSAVAAVVDPISDNLYDDAERAALPTGAVLASLGCGNPTALAELRAGEVVLDLGSGGGIDVLLSARRVGPTGKAYGLDMTDEMLALARRNQAESGLTNVEFLRGHIEQIPLPDHSVDVIISNCVINLSADKRTVLREAFRVLKPGGRFAVSDILSRGDVPDAVRQSMTAWVGCIAGAMDEQAFLQLIAEAGFTDASVEPTREYGAAEARDFLQQVGLPVDGSLDAVHGRFFSGFVRATKPAEAPAHA